MRIDLEHELFPPMEAFRVVGRQTRRVALGESCRRPCLEANRATVAEGRGW